MGHKATWKTNCPQLKSWNTRMESVSTFLPTNDTPENSNVEKLSRLPRQVQTPA